MLFFKATLLSEKSLPYRKLCKNFFQNFSDSKTPKIANMTDKIDMNAIVNPAVATHENPKSLRANPSPTTPNAIEYRTKNLSNFSMNLPCERTTYRTTNLTVR